MKKPRQKPVCPPLERRVVVGVIGAPHGVRGEVRVKSYTGDPLAIGDYGVLFADDGRVFEIEDGRPPQDDMLVLRFLDLADRDQAQKLTGLELFIDRDTLPPPEEEDEFYHADLIGLRVVDGAGADIGIILAVHNHGAGDLLEIKPVSDVSTWLHPFTKAGVPKVDLAAKCVVIDPAFLAKPDSSKPPPGET
jgi:16S rRNA processing protein RimM